MFPVRLRERLMDLAKDSFCQTVSFLKFTAGTAPPLLATLRIS